MFAWAIPLTIGNRDIMDKREMRKKAGLLTRCRLLLIAVAVVVTIAGSGCGGREASIEQGIQALTDYGCRSCHTIPGIHLADGVVGPPLDFWGSRWYIAGALVNTPDNLVLWLMDPQAVEPGTVMPGMGVTETDARNMGDYLYTLQAGDRGHVSVRGYTGDALIHFQPEKSH
jgi:cytochrome c2